jgi:hypothetical protein
MKEGYVKIHRKIADNEIWTKEPFTDGQAWVDLIMLANHKDGYFKVRGNRVVIQRGQLGWSVLSLSRRWMWSRGKAQRFLDHLETVQQIEQQKSRLTTIISIVNYDEYQVSDTTERATDGQQTDINKKYSIESIDNFTTYYNRLLSFFPSKFRPKNKSQQNAWIETLDKLVRIDGLDTDTIEKIIKWARADEFWEKNFMTLIKLRQKNKEQIPYWTVFQAKMESSTGSSTVSRYRKINEQEERR